MRGVEHQRLAGLHFVTEELRVARVPALGHPRHARGRLAFFLVEVDVEVIGLQDLELEILVLDLVPAEVLRLSAGGDGQQDCNRGKKLPHNSSLEENSHQPEPHLAKVGPTMARCFSARSGPIDGKKVTRLSPRKYAVREFPGVVRGSTRARRRG